ncbi:hypothetical protein [Paeniglutamicibacter gangotriensis]|uniref:Uncharacterized protein n=1 Tax=Paeniglutamicibacter gangotriensis Lz1y TaxID=1276920 RepID=M7N9A1_9MICC|nr:hypothetical protein [Paeniglutamicibacter gangotriensis]EMQ98359.1 hypothetical protein ADIAG_02378 [Paeniglutamicibacter gangotriensis Lz1y]
MVPRKPTIVELEIAVDTSKFMRALRGINWDRATPFETAMTKVQATVDHASAAMIKIDQIAKEAAATTGANLDEIKTILEGIATAARPHYGGYGIRPWNRFGETPDQELNRRLNQRLRGEDPGPPVNWKGLPR